MLKLFQQKLTEEDAGNVQIISKLENSTIIETVLGKYPQNISLFLLMGLYAAQRPDTILRSQNLSFKLETLIDFLPNKTIWNAYQKLLEDNKKFFQEHVTGNEITKFYETHFELLWYLNLPCFDVKGQTSDTNGQKSVFKKCVWKGKVINCSAIFKKIPTDKGMCCGFNKDIAENIFVESKYTRAIKKLETFDKSNAFENADLPKWYVDKNEPKSQVGRKRGLTVILDAHNDLLTEFSVNSDFHGFTAVVSPPGDFPFIANRGFEVKPGHVTAVAMTATKVVADVDIQSIEVGKRNCMFKDETSKLKLHKNYTQTNCILECGLLFARELLKNTVDGVDCTPWYFPVNDEGHKVCSPWQKVQLLDIMDNNLPYDTCNYCLSDCNRVIYHKTISTQPFRQCNEKNLGMTDFCSFEGTFLDPPMWGQQVLDQLNDSGINVLLGNIVRTSRRTLNPVLYNQSMFTKLQRDYDAYDEDISVLSVFFESPTAIQYSTKQSRTWVDFISAVGGNGGLFIGFTIVTILELLWLMIRLLTIWLLPTDQ